MVRLEGGEALRCCRLFGGKQVERGAEEQCEDLCKALEKNCRMNER